jgi:translation initiation factor IF-3
LHRERGSPQHHVPTGGPSISQQQRINAEIKLPRVRLISAEGEQVGVVQLSNALRAARDVELDLVEVAPNAEPVTGPTMQVAAPAPIVVKLMASR